MRLYDITVPLSVNTPTYPGDPSIEISDWKSLASGDAANVSLLHFGAHSATHVDAPAHFIDGARCVDELPLEVLLGEAQVIELPKDREFIDAEFVSRALEPHATRVLFKTRNSSFWSSNGSEFRKDFTYLDLAAARVLVEFGIALVGIDYLSIEQFHSEKHETHLYLLENEVIILEGLNLANVDAGQYELICLPLKISAGKGDGAPARAVLRRI